MREVSIGKPFSGFFHKYKTVFLTDVHASFPGIREKALLREIRKICPDIIFLGGDYVSWSGEYKRARAFLRKLKVKTGIIGVLGDADYQNSRESCLFCHNFGSTKQLPIRFLRNRSVFLPYGNTRMKITGLETFFGNNFLRKSRLGKASRRPRIILTHKQFNLDEIPDQPVLILAGDTHGGQAYLPDFVWQILFGKSKGSLRHGIVKNGERHLLVSAGIGTNTWPLRFFCPPEVILFKGE